MILSICFASAMLFASQTLSKTLITLQEDMYKASTGTSDVIITSDSEGYFNSDSLDLSDVQVKYIVKEALSAAVYSDNDSSGNIIFTLKGFTYDDVSKFNPITFHSVDDSAFDGNKIIIGSYSAEKLGLVVGSEIAMSINGVEYKFEVYGISMKNGLFVNDGQRYTAIIPFETLTEILVWPEGYVSEAYIALNDSAQKEMAVKTLSTNNPELNVEHSYSEETIEEESKTLMVQMYVLLIIISIMSFYIIFSSFKVLITERLPDIGTFRSIGANKRQTSLMLIVESGIYGVLGGIAGIGLGLFILYIIVRISMTGELDNIDIKLTFSASDIIVAFLWAVILAIFSALLPVRNTSKKPIKNIVLNISESGKVKKKSGLRLFISLMMIFLSVVVLYTPIKKYAIVIDSISLFLMIVGVFWVTPYILHFVTVLFEKVYVLFPGNTGVIALKNIRNSKENCNNVLLLELAVATAISVFTVTGSIVSEINNLTSSSYKFDLIVQAQQMDDSFVNDLSKTDGVLHSYGIYMQRNVSIDDSDDGINLIEGIETSEYMRYREFGYDGSETEAQGCLDRLDDGRNIILTYMLLEKYDLQIGDTIILETTGGDASYKIVGAFYSLLEKSGNYALISEGNFKYDFDTAYYSQVYVKAENADEIDNLKNGVLYDFRSSNISVTSVNELVELSQSSSRQKTSIFNGLSCVVVIICFFGLLNNLIMNYLERRKIKSIMRSIGMTKGSGILIILIEAVTSGFIGGVMGVAEGLGIIHISKFVMKSINKPYPIEVSPIVILSFFSVALVSSVLAFIFLELKTRDISISEEIKGR